MFKIGQQVAVNSTAETRDAGIANCEGIIVKILPDSDEFDYSVELEGCAFPVNERELRTF